jgi:hypothetical protein
MLVEILSRRVAGHRQGDVVELDESLAAFLLSSGHARRAPAPPPLKKAAPKKAAPTNEEGDD